MAAPRVAVVGGGLAGLMTTIKLAEAGVPVDLFSIVPVKRSHSVCAQGGINGAVNVKGEDDSPEIHFADTCRGGDFLAHQPPVKGMCYAAPGVIYLFDRMGVTFNRTPEGLLDFRRFGGTLHHRTAFAGATTGQQLLYALDEQVRRHEAAGVVKKYEGWEFVGLVRDDGGRCAGLVALDLKSMKPVAFAAGAVVMATGGPGLMFGRSTNSIINSGSAAAAAYMDGADYANGEFIQIHPTAIPGMDKLRLMSESARGEGGRVWVPRQAGDTRAPGSIPEAERFYFLEEKYPKYKNLVPRDVASREIHHVCVEQGLGVGGDMAVYLDLTHVPRETLKRAEARGHPRDLRKVHGRRPDDDADEDLPGRPLLDGRAVGGLQAHRRRLPGPRIATQPGDQRARALRGRRVRVPVPRRESPRRELAALVRVRGTGRGARGARVPARVREECRRAAGVVARGRAGEMGRATRGSLEARRHGESVQACGRAREGHDGERHHRPRQQEVTGHGCQTA
jgi:hypothetical protein